MVIPGWVFWFLGWGVIALWVYRLRRIPGGHDWSAPIFEWVLILIGAAFTFGWIIKGCIG